MLTIHRLILAMLLAIAATSARADTYPRQPGIDATHYVFRLRLTDASNEIAGETTATFRVAEAGMKELYLDLTSVAGGKGMTVSAVTVSGKPVQHTHQANRLRIPLSTTAPGTDVIVTVAYRGVPGAGLRIGDNIYNQRSMFSEN